MLVTQSFLEALKAKVSTVDLVSRVIEVVQRGRNHLALCPFHAEKTPSFTVFPDGGCYCYGCKWSGDGISFAQEYWSLTFAEAVEKIADMFGLVVEYTEQGKRERLESVDVRTALATAAEICHKLLLSRPKAIEYFAKRGVTEESIKEFQIGLCGSSSWFRDQMLLRGCSIGVMQKAGLWVEDDGKPRARFQRRLLFPIRDRNGNVIGFGGRVIDTHGPKYLNSADSAHFQKSRALYGIDRIKRATQTILVGEGYLDVVAMNQVGLSSVAPMGTSLTVEQAKILKRICKKVVFCFDGDEAGQKAAEKAVDLMGRIGLACAVYALPEGSDPADLVREHGSDWYDESKELAPVQYLFSQLDTGEQTLGDGYALIRQFIGTQFEGLAIESMARRFGMSERSVRSGMTVARKEKLVFGQKLTSDAYVIAALLTSQQLRDGYSDRHGEHYLQSEQAKKAWLLIREQPSLNLAKIDQVVKDQYFRRSVMRAAELIDHDRIEKDFRSRMETMRLTHKRKKLVECMRLGEKDVSGELDEVNRQLARGGVE